MPLRRYVCEVCARTGDGELETWGVLCVDCADRVLDRLYALDYVLVTQGVAAMRRMHNALGDLEPDPFAPEPIPRRRGGGR